MKNAAALDRSDTVQNVLKELRGDIILYRYRNGEQVKEVELCRKYGCSRTAVRNAFIILEKEGLIVARENGTKEVACLSSRDIDNIYDLRHHIEITSIKQFFAEKGADMSPVFEAINLIRALPDDASVGEILRLDTNFHAAIVHLSKNKALFQTWSNICMVMEELFTMNMSESNDYENWFVKTFAERHIDIMSKILLSEQSVIDLLTSHIEDARETSKKALKKLTEKGV